MRRLSDKDAGPLNFWRSVLAVLSGSVVAQAIPVLGSLVLARLYAPVAFGVFATWLGVVMLAAVVVTGRLEMALAIEPDGPARRSGVLATFWTAWIGSLLLALLATLAWLALPPSDLIFGSAVLMLALGTAQLATLNIWQAWAAADGAYPALSAMRMAQAFMITIVQICMGWFWPTASGLMIGQLIGMLFAIGIAAWLLPLRGMGLLSWRIASRALPSFWRKHRRFPAVALPADAINTASAQLPLMFITARFGAEASGLYALTQRVLGAPISLVAGSVLDVFKRAAADSFRSRGHCVEEYRRTFLLLAAGALALVVAVVLLADWLFLVAFGPPWRGSAAIALWLLPMFALRFVASPLSYVLYIADKQHVDLLWQLALLAVTLAAFALPGGFEASVQIYSTGYAALYIVYAMLSYRFSQGRRP